MILHSRNSNLQSWSSSRTTVCFLKEGTFSVFSSYTSSIPFPTLIIFFLSSHSLLFPLFNWPWYKSEEHLNYLWYILDSHSKFLKYGRWVCLCIDFMRLLYVESKKKKNQVVSRGCEVREMGSFCQRYKFSVIRWISSGNLKYIMVITVNNTVVYTWKFLKDRS